MHVSAKRRDPLQRLSTLASCRLCFTFSWRKVSDMWMLSTWYKKATMHVSHWQQTPAPGHIPGATMGRNYCHGWENKLRLCWIINPSWCLRIMLQSTCRAISHNWSLCHPAVVLVNKHQAVFIFSVPFDSWEAIHIFTHVHKLICNFQGCL